jgi:hypothetical protein
MGNYRGRAVRRKHDEWYFYDQLPTTLKLRIAGATLPWSCSTILTRYRKIKKTKGRIAALSAMMDLIESSDEFQAKKRPWTPSKGGKLGEPTPCAIVGVGPLVTRFSNVNT